MGNLLKSAKKTDFRFQKVGQISEKYLQSPWLVTDTAEFHHYDKDEAERQDVVVEASAVAAKCQEDVFTCDLKAWAAGDGPVGGVPI